MELQKAPLDTAMAILADKGAPATIPAPDFALHRSRNVPRALGYSATVARVVRGGQFLPGKVLKQRGQSPIDDLADVSVVNLMAQEVLRAPQLRVGLGASRELNRCRSMALYTMAFSHRLSTAVVRARSRELLQCAPVV